MSPEPTIYLDSNATTPLDPVVLEAMMPYLTGFAGNASSRHSQGRAARRAIDQARQTIAHFLGASPSEIHFTSGATEANNLAIFGAAANPAARIFVNPADHPSCTEPVHFLEKRGHAVQHLMLDELGHVVGFRPEECTPGDLAVVQLANSETGCIQSIAAMASALPRGVHFHCDAVQAVGKIPVHFHDLGVTTLSLSGHKLHGPAGIGALLVRSRTKLQPLLQGGKQQQGLRPGTESLAAIVGLATAIEQSGAKLAANEKKLRQLRDYLERELCRRIPDVVVNGPRENRLPNTTNLSFLGAHSEPLVIALDLAGVCASAGTACSSGSMEPSVVLRSMRISTARLQSAVRFSIHRFQTEAELSLAVERIARVVERIRRTLPLGAVLENFSEPEVSK